MKPYPQLGNGTLDDLNRVLDTVVKQRTQDVKDFDNLQNTYVAGRKVAKIPTGATDISPTDRVGDVNADTNYKYEVIDNNGNAEWRRTPLASW